MVGFGANRRGGRLPSFILIFLMVIIAILSFNYWAMSSKHNRLLDELVEVQSQVKRTDAARSRLEKRNSELMVQVDTHRKQIDQKDGDYSVLESKLQAREALIKKCNDEKMKVQGDVTAQMTEIQRLKEQLKELKQEFMKQEEQLREVKKNSTTLERKLEYESLQCGRQIAQQREECEETKKTLEEEASKLRQSVIDSQKGAAAGRHAEGAPGVEMAGERHTVATHRHDSPDLKEMGKPGSDAGMPGIEDSEVGKIDDVQFALKKPAITQKHDEAPDVVVGAGAGPGVGAADGPGGQGLSLDQPRLQQDRVEGRAAGVAPLGIIKPADKPIVFEEDNKAGIKADELGEQQRQLRAPDNVKGDNEHLKGIPLPPNPAQVPNPIQPHHAKDQVAAEPVHHRQSRFFDENESPVDPQHGSKLADYNGDDGNVGEYEADKQAELAYNEEEDGDGGEEDVQDDDDRDMQGDRAVDYGKRHQAIDIL
ncbi:protein GOLM2 isoform X2 [Plectropomus leopardus]|uniref:protein GOLM2 isoform X2 n=1 Tax=Plectropomus leopardus TaxID=160734 RepID=UPI001C4DB56C|nr:protein GOLM2 isoform X2 [Plectropomus leopardus]